MLGQQTSNRQPRWSFEDMYQLFPKLRERANTEAGVLSGGEQQMLTLCRSLMGDPDLIIIDEPTEGLAPLVVAQVADYLTMLKNKGVSVLLIEQKLTIAMRISDRVAVMGHGRIAFEGTPDQLRDRADVRHMWLEVNG
jgi:branched-chain amino acid transport system ATP-binding protein